MQRRTIALVLLASMVSPFLACESSQRAATPAAADTPSAPAINPTATPTAPWFTSPSMDGILLDAREVAAVQPSFAGVWFSPPSSALHIATTDPSAMESVLHEFVRQGAELKVVEVRYTYAELATISDRVGDDHDAGFYAGVALAGWGVNELCNCVNIEVTNLTYEQRVVILSRYGPMAQVEEGGPNIFDSRS